MVATLAIDHTITHDLPPYPSLSPIHRAKRENKMVEFSYPSSHTHNTYRYMYIHIHICCTTSSARPTNWHVVQTCLHSHPSIIIIVTRKTPRELLTTRKICGTMYMYMTCTYRLDGAGWYYYPHVVCPVHVNTWRIIGPVIIMRSTLTGTSTGYTIHHATSIAMTSYLLALASTSIGDRSVSFSPRGRISPYMY